MLVDLVDAVSETCGPKAGNLGRLRRAGFPVPDGFVVRHTVPDSLLTDLVGDGLAKLGEGLVAVRSSAANEDTEHAAAAGQYLSVLGVSGVPDVVAAVRRCRAEVGVGPVAMGVLVQQLVAADVAGVLFTPTAQDQPTRIESAWGLGPSVVGGTVTPDAFEVDATGRISRRIADKPTRWDHTASGLVQARVEPTDRGRPSLDDDCIDALVTLGRRVADLLGPGQDIEWALAGDHLVVLQARPITAELPAASACETSTGGWSGTPGSPGRATGPARIVHGPDDFTSVRPGDVLVCAYTDPAWTPLLRIVSGVVTETGGVLSHAAIVARERGIPAVLGVAGAMTEIGAGVPITIDGGLGTVAAQHLPN